MSTFTSGELELPEISPDSEITRLDLIFYGVDHSGPSYTARVFFDEPSANLSTPTDTDHGYVGSFTVFGHGDCYGDVGHCDIHAGTHDEYDLRPIHPLTPWTKTVIIAPEVLRAAAPNKNSVRVRVVAVTGDAKANRKPLIFERIRLATYAN